jgi:protoporphyrin/coproporphyrin ferrochelatase
MKKAVILFNLGGPDSLDAVKPFLFNLFNDKNIITIPNPMRYLLAKLISSKRAPIAQEIYKNIGNKSPILEETEKQALALEQALNGGYTLLNAPHPNPLPEGEGALWKVFIAMRYWHPFSSATIEKVREFAPDEIVLLPLYPQFSTTTSKSSMDDWIKTAASTKLDVPTRTICGYHNEEGFINAHAAKITPYYENAARLGKTRILFSAHGLPEQIIKKGDPYQRQVEETTAAVVQKLAIDGLDYKVCYQSKVGRLKWIGPSTDDEIKRAGAEGLSLVVVPIAFVSEHSETLVELDIEYAHLAKEAGVQNYFRVPALGDDGDFIEALAKVCVTPQAFICNCYKTPL